IKAFCEALTQRARLAHTIPLGSFYRLPTEAEWEYACRAWTSTRFGYGDDPGYSNLTQYAWCKLNYTNNGTQPVGQKLPNLWGLYDMHGNVWEWCEDPHLYYVKGPAVDPRGPTPTASAPSHMVRGG